MKIDDEKNDHKQGGTNSTDDAVNCGLNVEQRNLLQTELQHLQDTVPPRAVWQRIEQQAKAEGLLRPAISERSKWFAGAGLAAAVLLSVLNLPLTPQGDDVSDGFETVPEFSAVSANNSTQDLHALNALMVQSQQIERNLRALPAQPSLVRAGTALTIAQLEDQIAAIDFTLNHPDLDLTQEQEKIYWRERVRLMNSLLSLRTAQSQRVSF